MITDALVAFVPIGGNLSLVGGAGVAIPSQNIIDLLGQGVGSAPSNIIGNATVFGEDAGVGGNLRPEINVTIGTACTGAGGQLLKIALQGAIDSGVGGNYQPGTWTDIVSQDSITMANLVSGAVPFRVPFLPTMPASLRPRFLRLLFTPMTSTTLPSGNLTAGTIASALVTWVRDDLSNRFATSNFRVA